MHCPRQISKSVGCFTGLMSRPYQIERNPDQAHDQIDLLNLLNNVCVCVFLIERERENRPTVEKYPNPYSD